MSISRETAFVNKKAAIKQSLLSRSLARHAPSIINLQFAIEVGKPWLFKQLRIKRVADAKLR